MELSNSRVAEITKRLVLSRTRILLKFPFYGLLLMHVGFGVDTKSETAYTDGEKIVFSPDFIDSLTDTEVDIVMMHEILHIVLRHCYRGHDLEHERFNIACDIVVNSNIMYSAGLGIESVALKCDAEPWNEAPNGRPGYLYTAEEVYKMLPSMVVESGRSGFDEHEQWGRDADEQSQDDLWDQRVMSAAEAAKGSGKGGGIPHAIELRLEELCRPKHDWRTILNNFIQEEVNDYSFSPPDRRYEGDFFLPDFNDTDTQVKNILFMVDTSGSMSLPMVKDMYAEIFGAIEQFGGKLSGWLGFFDDKVIPPTPFCSVSEFKMIKPKGGGGTEFGIVFDYVKENMQENMPEAIVILTDGYAEFPPEKAAMGIPVMWVINTSVVPPFGKLIRV